MYHGSQLVPEWYHSTRYVAGVGELPTRNMGRTTKHRYTCDHCGKLFLVISQATEDFYCPSASCAALGREVGITDAPAVTHHP